MNVLIIEDEKPAADKLILFLQRYDPNIKVLDVIQTVQGTIDYFEGNNVMPDLLFMDISLHDGLCFDIFKEVSITKPVIFVTAFNQYALEAFKVNSVAYLVKPLSYDSFYNSMKKLDSLKENLPKNIEKLELEQLRTIYASINQEYKQRFMVKIGEHLRSVQAENIVLFYAEGRTVTMLTNSLNKYIVDYKMEELETMLNPEMFFRLSRTYHVNINFIKDTLIYSNSRLKITLSIPFESEIIVSREKVKLFKKWFDGAS